MIQCYNDSMIQCYNDSMFIYIGVFLNIIEPQNRHKAYAI